MPAPVSGIRQLDWTVEFRQVRWKGLDFSGSRLAALRTFDVRIEDCVFDRCEVLDWRMWTTQFIDCTFVGADLRNLAWGGIWKGKRNRFERVRFQSCKLARASFGTAEFVDCAFVDAGLESVRFAESRHVRTRFEGELSDCEFYRREKTLSGEPIPPNEMEDVDLRKASLHFVRFGHLDMNTVRWPDAELHVLLEPYVPLLDRMLALLAGREDRAGRVLRAILADKRKWAGSGQQRGVFCLADLEERADREIFAELLAQARGH